MENWFAVEINAAAINARGSKILDMCSESESDAEQINMSNVWFDYDADTSENESIDSDHEDLLKYVYIIPPVSLCT